MPVPTLEAAVKDEVYSHRRTRCLIDLELQLDDPSSNYVWNKVTPASNH